MQRIEKFKLTSMNRRNRQSRKGARIKPVLISRHEEVVLGLRDEGWPPTVS
jgi:hypothetical protein